MLFTAAKVSHLNLLPQGIQELNSLVRRFPNTPEASLARDKLTALESEPPAPARTTR